MKLIFYLPDTGRNKSTAWAGLLNTGDASTRQQRPINNQLP